jgi:hypothetical protein
VAGPHHAPRPHREGTAGYEPDINTTQASWDRLSWCL